MKTILTWKQIVFAVIAVIVFIGLEILMNWR